MSFSKQIDAWVKLANERLLLATRKIAIDAFTRIVIRSPVDTGRFRGNWVVSVDQLPNDAPDVEGVGPFKSESAILQEVELAAASFSEGNHSIYFVNNLPYARPLEYGHSSQAPNGMVRITVAEFKTIIKQVLEQIRRSGS